MENGRERTKNERTYTIKNIVLGPVGQFCEVFLT